MGVLLTVLASADSHLNALVLHTRAPDCAVAPRATGCCKTTLVRAAATASGAHVVALSGAALFSMYVGQGEALLRSAFQRARQAAPSIIFLDELDALVGAVLVANPLLSSP